MPDQGLLPPLDAAQYPDYLNLLRKQQMAQALMGAFQQSNQTPTDWNAMRVVPKKSMFSQVANIAEGLAAGKMNRDAFKAQSDYLMAPYQAMQGDGAAAASSAGGSASPPASAAGGIVPNAAPTVSPPQQPNAMYLTGDLPTSQRLYQMMGPQEYAKALAGRYAPTDLEKQLRAAGIDPTSPQGRQALTNAVNKAGFIEPIGGARPGTIAFDPITHQPLFAQPDVTHNVNLGVGPEGVTASPIPGNAQAQGQLAQQEALGKTLGTPQVLPTAGGGSSVILPQGMGGSGSPMGRPAPKVGQPTASAAPTTPPGLEGMPRLPVSSALGAPDAYTEGRLKAAGAKDAELASQYGKEADLADQKLQYNIDARKLLDTAELGPSSEWMTENRAKLLEWGVPESVIPGAGKVTDTMELNKYLKQSALQGARQIFGSRMTQMEVKLQHEELSPSTAMTKDAIASLMRTDDIKQMYAKQRAEDYGKYQAAGGDPLRFESWYAKNHPLTAFAKQHAEVAAPAAMSATPAAAAANPRAAPAVGTIQGGYIFKGGDPSKKENWELSSDRHGVIQR